MTMMLLEWVITSIFLILTVLALRAAFGRRVSARLRYALWTVVLARLLVPMQLFTSPLAGTRFFSASRIEQTVTEWLITSDTHITFGPDIELPVGGQVGMPAARPNAPEPPAAPDLTKLPSYLGWIWLSGSTVLTLVLAASNLRFALRLRRSRIPLEGADCALPVYAAAGLPSPCLFGLAQPAIYVTPEAAADPSMLRHVIAHEYTHFRQGDHLWSFLRCAALAAHWWNPLVWLSVKLSRRDGELACDEGTLKRLGDGERLAYGNTLLALVTAKPSPGDLLCFATTMAGEKKSLKERVSRIAHAPKRWLWAALVLVLVTVLACACAFSSAEKPDAAEGAIPETPDATVTPETPTIVPPIIEPPLVLEGGECPMIIAEILEPTDESAVMWDMEFTIVNCRLVYGYKARLYRYDYIVSEQGEFALYLTDNALRQLGQAEMLLLCLPWHPYSYKGYAADHIIPIADGRMILDEEWRNSLPVVLMNEEIQSIADKRARGEELSETEQLAPVSPLETGMTVEEIIAFLDTWEKYCAQVSADFSARKAELYGRADS